MKLYLNLASRSYLDRRRVYGVYGVAILAIVLLLVVNISALVRNQLQVRQLRGYLSELGVEDGSGEGRISAADLKKMQGDIIFANDILIKDGFRWTALLNNLEDVVRQGITIRLLQPDYRAGSLKVSGLARDLKGLREFLDRIQASEHFDSVYLFEQAQDEIEDNFGVKRPVTSFSILLKGAF